jgi:hypothetical protein
MNIDNVTFAEAPDYTYEQLKKGIACFLGHSFMRPYNKELLICPQCEAKESIESAVLRSVEEFLLLFPERKITTVDIHDWCKIIPSLKTVRRILMENYTIIRSGRSSYYQ